MIKLTKHILEGIGNHMLIIMVGILCKAIRTNYTCFIRIVPAQSTHQVLYNLKNSPL